MPPSSPTRSLVPTLASLALALVLLLAPAARAQNGPVYKTLVNPDFRHLLVIHSQGQGSAPVEGVNQGIRMVLDQTPANVLVRTEHMDMREATAPRHVQLFEDLLRIKYKGAHFDGVITSGQPALHLASRLRSDLFSDTSIMAAGVDMSGDIPADLEGIHVIGEHLKHAETLLLALRHNPSAKRIFIINIPAPGAPALSAPLAEVVASLSNDYEVTLWENMPPGAIEQHLANTGKNDIVYLADYVRTGETGLDMSFEDVRRMAYTSAAPMYVSREFFMDSGVVGGVLSSWREQGRRATWMTLDLWAGRYVRKQFDDVSRAGRTMLDFGPMKRFGFDVAQYPSASIINAPVKKFDDYRKYFDIYVVGGVFAVLILLMLLIHLRRQAALKKRLAKRRSP